MSTLVSTLRGILLLDQATYERFRDSKDAMKKGVLILLVAFLLAGSLQFLVDLANNIRPFGAEEAAEFKEEFLQGFEQWQQFMPQDEEFRQVFMDQFLQNFEVGLSMGVAIDALPTPLPKGIARFFETLGAWLTKTFSHLGAWLAYAIWVLLFAKLLGGNGGVDRFLGLTALYAVPAVLGILSPIACVGPLIAFLGTVWGWVIYVKAVQVSQRFTVGKAIVATLLPALLLILLVALLGLLSLLGIISAASSGQ